MTATGTVEGSIARVIEGAVASVDWGLAIRLGALGRIPDGDPLGIAFEPASHRCVSPFARFPFIGQGVLHFAFIPAQLFPRGPLKTELEVRAQISRCASGAGGRT